LSASHSRDRHVPHDQAHDAERDGLVRARAERDGPLRRRLLLTFAHALRDLRQSPDTIRSSLRAARDLSSVERRFLGDAVHDVVRLRRRLTFLAGGEAPELLLDQLLADRRDPAGSAARLAAIADPLERLAVSASYPDFLVARWVAEYGPTGAAELAEAMNRRAPLTVRANRLKATRDELAGRLADLGIAARPTALAQDGLTLLTRQNVHSMAPFRDGWMELQDEGSQLIAELCAPPPRGSVIDACAGAGGKTLAIGALLGNAGRLFAYDVSPARLDEFKLRARRAGLTNAQAIVVREGPPDSARPADRVLLDVPCSGTGALRRNPEARWRLAERDLRQLADRQREILEAYADLVVPGGRLIYATCSVLDEENAAVVDAFLRDHPAFEPVPVKEIVGRERALAMGDGEALRLLPHVHGTDGFYARVLRRRRQPAA
jgi:16S rRNA (cytosine967-C5)-methyltransferase